MLQKTIYPDDPELKLKLIEADTNGYEYKAVYNGAKLSHYQLIKKNTKQPCNCGWRK